MMKTYSHGLVFVAGLSLAALLLGAKEEPVLLVVGVGGPGEGVQAAGDGGRVGLRLAGRAARRRRHRLLRNPRERVNIQAEFIMFLWNRSAVKLFRWIRSRILKKPPW